MTSPSSAASSLHITITSNPSSSTITNNTNANNPKPHHHHLPSHSTARPGPNNNNPGGGGGGGGGGSSSTNQACAACKYQRRKCNPDCPLAPYFPADQQRRFLNAHRLFGVSNILKTLRRIKPELCDAAMNALIYQAEMRAIDPVGGCYRIILDLENTFELESAELAALLHHLELCRQAAAAAASGVPPPDVMDAADLDLEVTSSNHHQPSLAMDAVVDIDTLYVGQEAIRDDNNADHGNNNNSPHAQDHGEQQHQQQQQLYDYFYYETKNNGAGAAEDASSNKPGSVDINVDVMQHFDYDSGCDAVDDHSYKLAVELAPMMSSGGLAGQHHQLEEEHYGQIDHKEYEMKVASFVDAFDVNADIAASVKEEIDQEEDANYNMALAEESQLAESSHCRLGLGFSSL
ncbi:LOB domain-containing protein 20 [Brachypodium distachyon]|uniref:LOB domain-containing protein n=1 Tax=Brachypodium distachyon TaxID=15368 RepID=I1I6U6_BRADI|nr:LOB domain-containing protein 20 [Brachypodium distachyon]KQJ98172.1 hypothetical protein BRADI_3g35280v3 [Brachypodium distachyon]|eukprot:XP_003572169.1 LOB domain-containing protein 20 [Brachypodium distachyon]